MNTSGSLVFFFLGRSVAYELTFFFARYCDLHKDFRFRCEAKFADLSILASSFTSNSKSMSPVRVESSR